MGWQVADDAELKSHQMGGPDSQFFQSFHRNEIEDYLPNESVHGPSVYILVMLRDDLSRYEFLEPVT